MKLLRHMLIPSITALFLFAGQPLQAVADEGLTTVPCAEFDLAFLDGEEGVSCERAEVPADYDQPDGAQISLGVVILKAESALKAPIFVLSGGPGGSAIDSYVDIFYGHPLREKHDIIIFDQRGTLYSEPFLFCEEVLETTLSILSGPEEPEADYADTYLDAYQSCYQRLIDQGIDLADYNSVSNAHDIETLRASLAYDQIILYGSSYGTLLAQHYLRAYPDQVKSAILDAVVSPEINFLTEAPNVAQGAFDLLFATCKADPACDASYPDLAENYRRTYLRLAERPLEITLTDPETGISYETTFNNEDFRSFTFQLLYSTDLVPFMPRIIRDISAGRLDEVKGILEILTFDRTQSDAMYYATICAEDADFSLSDVNVFGLSIDLAEIELDSARFVKDLCARWDLPELPPTIDETISTEIPVLLLSGAFDPITPPAYAADADQEMSQGVEVLFTDGAHTNLLNEPCAERLISDFIAFPEAPVDTACAAAETIDFFTGDEIVDVPVVARALRGDGGALGQTLALAFMAVVLFSSYLILPLALLVMTISRNRPPAAGTALIESEEGGGEKIFPRRPLAARVASFLLLLQPAILSLFIAGVVVTHDRAVAAGDFRVLYGLPAEIRPLFILPILFILLTGVMLPLAIRLWRRQETGLAMRLYFSAMILPALAASVLLITTSLAFGILF